MATEVLDIVIRQRGARVVARDIAKIGVAADSANRSIKGLQASLRSAQNSLQKVKNSTTTATTAMKGFGGAAVGARRSLTALGTGVALIGGAISAALIRPLIGAIKVAGDFQAAMNLTGVLLQVDRAGAAFKELEERAKQLGITTVFSAVEAAEGMQFLAKAGFDANEILGAIGPTTDLAAAANLDLGRAADISTNILRGFRLTVEEFPAAVDILASAFTRSNATIEEFANSFRDAGPVAVDFNQRFSDVASVLSALADAGIKSQKAGIALRRIFINLETDAAKLAPVLNRAGISIREIGEDGVERLRPLNEIFVDVANSSISTADKITLFGARALAAAGIIEDSAEGLENFAKILESDFGRASDVAKARLLGFNGAVIELISAVKGLGIEIVQGGILDFLEGIVDGVTSFIRAVAGLPQPIKTAIGVIAGLAGVVALLTLKIGLLIIAMAVLKGAGGIGGVTDALKKMSVAVRAVGLFFLTNPIGLLITALAVLGTALFLARDRIFEFGDQQFRLKDIISTTWDDIVDSFDTGAKSADAAAKAGKDAIDELDSAAEQSTFGETLSNIFLRLQFAAQVTVDVIGRLFLALFETLRKQFTLEGVAEAIERGDPLDAVVELFKTTGIGAALNFKESLETELAAGGGIEEIALEALRKVERRNEEAANRFMTAQEKRRKELERGGRQLPGGEPTTGVVVPVTLSKGEIERRATALDKLFDSLNNASKAEQELADARKVLSEAVTAGITSDTAASIILENLGAKIFRNLSASIDPVTANLREEELALKGVTAAAMAAGVSSEELARVQGLLAKKFRDARIELKEFQEGLGTGEAITLGLTKGFEDFADSLGNLFSNTREVVSSTLEGLLGEINKFVTTGEADFAGFARTVIAEIQKIIVKMIALQGIRAFEKTLEEGSGIAGFAKNLFGERLGAPGTPPTTAQQPTGPGVSAPGTTTAAGFEFQGPLFGGAQAQVAAAVEVPGKNPADPVHSSLTPDSPGVVALRDGISMKIDQSKTATVEQLSQILSSIRVQNEAMRAAGVTGSSGSAAVTSSLEAVTETTGQGLVENKNEVAKQGGIVDKTTQQGFKDSIGTAVTVGGNIIRALQSGEAGDQGAAIGSIIGLAIGAFAGNPALGAQIGGQAGGIIGGLQEGGVLTGNLVGKPFLVGERGPELFVPPTTGMVVPNDMLGRLGGTPEINVQVVNVDDPQAIPDAITTREGERSVLNVITRNRGKLKEILA